MKSQNTYYGAIAAVVIVGLLMLVLTFTNTNPTAAPAPTLAASSGATSGNTNAATGGTGNQAASASANCPTTPADESLFTTTASGLKYRALTEGTGARPTAASSVTVHYCGVLPDGTQFDSSYDRGQSISFSLGGVIAGWTEGLQLMTVGSKYEFIIPGNLGYGAAGFPPDIPPNATLLFTVELLGIQ
jgi:FKBP-type peptidyl-prolyl cis-trans isomerase